MTKTRAWPVRAMYMLIAAALVISLIIVAVPAQKVSADPGLSEWDIVPTPAMMDDWVLAPNFTITGFAPGTTAIYVIGTGYEDNDLANAPATKPQLLKSTDEAATWKNLTDGLVDEVVEQDLGDDIDDITLVKVACDFVNPDFVAVALVVTMGTPSTADDELHVFISNDGGTTFRDTGEVDAALSTAGAAGVLVFAVSSEVAGMRNIAIGGTDSLGAPTTPLLFRCLAIGGVGTGWGEDPTTYTGWDNDGAASVAVVAFSFAPSWATDNTVLVLTVNTGLTNVYLQSGTWGTVEAWNDDAGFEKAVAIFTVATNTITYLPGVAGINTPFDYSGQDAAYRYLWVNVNYVDVDSTKIGEIFRVKNKSVMSINQQVEGQPWLSGVSYFGYISEGKAIASLYGVGNSTDTDCCEGVLVYRNDSITDMDICCLAWEVSCKPPTGRGVMAAFYMSADKAYAVALFDGYLEESAWSVSFDDGDTWNQLSLVNTWIDYLSDVAVSPDCNKTMLVSVNLVDMSTACDCEGCTGCDSTWLNAEDLPEAAEYSGQWLRTWCGQLEGDNSADFTGRPEYGLLRLAPEETTGDTVYLVDRMTSTIYWNELETLACWKQRSATSIITNIVDLGVKDESTIYALGLNGAVAMSDDHGTAPSWSEAVASGLTNGWTIAVRGDDILVGGQDGDWNYSADGGETWMLPDPKSPGAGYVTVAFDSYFDINDTVYAAVAGFSGGVPLTSCGVYRWVIDESEKWTDLRAEPLESQIGVSILLGPTTGDDTVEVSFTGLVLDRAAGNPMSSADTGGVLYASYVIANGYATTGVARHLTPAKAIVCVECGDWDYLHVGLTVGQEGFEAMPQALKICGCLTPDSNSNLFAIDWWQEYQMERALTGTVWTFEDCYSKAAPDVISPADGLVVPADPCGSCFNVPFSLRWDRQCDACSYDIQIALDEDFTIITYDSFDVLGESYLPPGAGDAPSYLVGGTLVCETTYYWRVRSADAGTGQIIHSWWSEPRSVMIAPSTAAGTITLVSPAPGDIDVAINNLGFSWSLPTDADSFDWVLSTNADLTSPVESKTGLTTTAYTCTKTLGYDTTYYWVVTAYNEGAAIGMSTVGTFRTVVEPTGPGDIPAPATPVWVWVVIAIGAVLVIVVIVLIFRTRRV